MSNSRTRSFLTLAVVSLTAAALAYNFALMSVPTETAPGETAGEKKPLYWVAPMDPNYRRDAPGKSPMGMDLVPVYADDAAMDEAGTVRISPDVVNNLGVRTAEVRYGSLPVTVETVGYLQYDEDRLMHIHPRVEGWVEQLFVKAAGDPVAVGEPLYSLYSPTLVNAQEELLLAQKRNNAALLDAALQRLASLHVSKEDVERIRSTGKTSQTVVIRAPQSGVLDNLMIREGMFVKPGMEMMSIAQLEHIWVIGEVFERQVADLRAGAAVTMTLDYLPGREWQGTVDYIYPKLDMKTRTARVRVHFDNEDGALRPGMFAQMRIKTPPADKTILVPREAVIRTGTKARVVLVRGEGKFKSVEVVLGRVGDSEAEVLSGLVEGDRVVTSAQFLLDSESSKTSDFVRMDHAAQESMDHSSHESMDHSAHDSMDHSAHESMSHSAHDSMDHSAHESMDHSAHESMDHSQHKSMISETTTSTDDETGSAENGHEGDLP